MHKSGENVSFWPALSMGIGAMVGAGIFALLGQAGAIAGSAVWISFVIGGVIALLSGYSLGRLGARYPAGGFRKIAVFRFRSFSTQSALGRSRSRGNGAYGWCCALR